MKEKIRTEKGVSLLVLVITIIIMLILTNMLIYNATDSIHIRNLNNLYNDISTLRENINDFYNKYGQIPAKVKYTNINNLSEVLSSKNDIGDFYVIDLEAMDGITLNYGKDYEKVKNDIENVNNYTDLYIINYNSHNIFYVAGIAIKENKTVKYYYTDYTEPDDTKVDLRYIDGILIPDGFYYIGKMKDNMGNESIVISDKIDEDIDTNKTNQYVWIKQISKIEQIPSSIILENEQKENEFITSVNDNKGYFRNIEGKVQYIINGYKK